MYESFEVMQWLRCKVGAEIYTVQSGFDHLKSVVWLEIPIGSRRAVPVARSMRRMETEGGRITEAAEGEKGNCNTFGGR